jgi:hypothetical protein
VSAAGRNGLREASFAFWGSPSLPFSPSVAPYSSLWLLSMITTLMGFSSPRMHNFMIGICSPSSYTSRDSLDSPIPWLRRPYPFVADGYSAPAMTEAEASSEQRSRNQRWTAQLKLAPQCRRLNPHGNRLSALGRECLTPRVLKDTFGIMRSILSSRRWLQRTQRRRIHAGIRH